MLKSTLLATCFFYPPATAMQTFTWIASLSINMTPWWFSSWIYFFYLDIFWVCLCALFCLLWFVCLFLYSAKNQHSIGSKWVLQQRATKRESNTCLLGFCLLLCIVFVVSRQAIHCNIFNIFTLCSRIIALLLYVSHQSHFIVQPFQSHPYVRRYNLVFEINWKVNI